MKPMHVLRLRQAGGASHAVSVAGDGSLTDTGTLGLTWSVSGGSISYSTASPPTGVSTYAVCTGGGIISSSWPGVTTAQTLEIAAWIKLGSGNFRLFNTKADTTSNTGPGPNHLSSSANSSNNTYIAGISFVANHVSTGVIYGGGIAAWHYVKIKRTNAGVWSIEIDGELFTGSASNTNMPAGYAFFGGGDLSQGIEFANLTVDIT